MSVADSYFMTVPQGLPGPIGMMFRGAYDPALAYRVRDVIRYGGSSFIAVLPVPAGIYPTNTTYWGLVAEKGSLDSEIIPVTGTVARLIEAILGDHATARDMGLNGRSQSGFNDGALGTAAINAQFLAATTGNPGAILRFTKGIYRGTTPIIVDRDLSSQAIGYSLQGEGSQTRLQNTTGSVIELRGGGSHGGTLSNFRTFGQGAGQDHDSAAIDIPPGETALDMIIGAPGIYIASAPRGIRGGTVSAIVTNILGDVNDHLIRNTRRTAKTIYSNILAYQSRKNTFFLDGRLTSSGNPMTEAVRDDGLGGETISVGPCIHDRAYGTGDPRNDIFVHSYDNVSYIGQVHNGKTPGLPVLNSGILAAKGFRHAVAAAYQAADADYHPSSFDYLRPVNVRGFSYKGGTVKFYERGAVIEDVDGLTHSAVLRMCNLRGYSDLGAITYLRCVDVTLDDHVIKSGGLGIGMVECRDVKGSMKIHEPWRGGFSGVDLLRAQLDIQVYDAAWGDSAEAPFETERDVTAIHISGSSTGVELTNVRCSLAAANGTRGQKFNIIFDAGTSGCAIHQGRISSFRNTGAAFTDRGTGNIVGDNVLGIERIKSVTADFTALRTHRRILADASGGPLTVRIPTFGQWYSTQPIEVIKTDGSSNAVRVRSENESQTINGQPFVDLTAQYGPGSIVSARPSANQWLNTIAA